MAKRAAPTPKRSRVSVDPRPKPGELQTLLDFIRYAVSRFVEARLVFAHGPPDPAAEAAFRVCGPRHVAPAQLELFATAGVPAVESKKLLDVIERRVTTRRPAAYLVNKIYMRDLP